MKSTISSQELMSVIREAEMQMGKGIETRIKALEARVVVFGYARNSSINVKTDPNFVQNVRDALHDFPDSLKRFNELIGA